MEITGPAGAEVAVVKVERLPNPQSIVNRHSIQTSTIIIRQQSSIAQSAIGNSIG